MCISSNTSEGSQVSGVSELLITDDKKYEVRYRNDCCWPQHCKQKFGGLWVTHTVFMCPIVLFMYIFTQQELIATNDFYQDLMLLDVKCSQWMLGKSER